MGNLENFKDKGLKYNYRHKEGLKILRTVTNIANSKKGYERLFLCDLPFKFHVLKIAYGIKLGVYLSNRELQYFEEVSVFER